MADVAELLPGWLRAVDLAPTASRLEGVTTVARAAGDEASALPAILGLVLLAYGVHGARGADPADAVAAALQEHEDAVIRADDLLTRITAAVAVAMALESSDSAVPFALGVQSAEFIGLGSTVPDLGSLATAGLAVASEVQRARHVIPSGFSGVETLMGPWPDLQGQPVTPDAFAGARSAVSDSVSELADVQENLAIALTQRLAALDEETEILWWVLGESSELADKPMKSLAAHAVGCVAGVELSGRTKLPAPVRSTRALLRKVLGAKADKAVTVAQAVPATLKLIGADWAKTSLEGPHPLLPVLSCVAEYERQGGHASWHESVKSITPQIDPARETTNLDLAEQVVRETLLVRVR